MSDVELSRVRRLDQKVVELRPSLSRAFAARLIADGKVSVNGSVETKPGYKLKADDAVDVDYDETELAQIPDIDLPIIYEDDDCVVINKPVGVLTHSKGAFNPEATVATWLRRHIAKTSEKGKKQPEQKSHFLSGVTRKTVGLSQFRSERAGIVHRLDRATSGVMICAKTPEALSWLQKQFSQRRTKKTYNAIVEGALKEEEAMIDMPIGRNPKAPATFRVDANGKSAQTQYKVLRNTVSKSLIELKPITGRTHQLRVHLKHLGHPIVGDALYGGKPADRLYLHATQLELTLPNRERKVFNVPLPATFTEEMERK